MDSVNIHEAKTHFSKLLEKLATGESEEIIIAKAGRPVAKLVPYLPLKEKPLPKRKLGLLANQVTYWESPDCWEPDEKLNNLMINGPIFPDESPMINKHESVAEDSENHQT